VLVNDLDVIGAGFRPDETDPESVVDALFCETGPVLTMTVASERFQTVAWRH
jgi:hypothetical protein